MIKTRLYHQQHTDKAISIWQQGTRRWLDFGDSLTQSAIDIVRPKYLIEKFHRAMLAAVMFRQQPIKNVLLAGVGGGAIARYFSHRFPEIKGDAVELSAEILALAQQYFDLPVGQQWQYYQADFRTYLQQCQQQYDLIIFDIADGTGVPAWLAESDFIAQCYRHLTPEGQLSINLIAVSGEHFLQHLSVLRQVFHKQTLCMSLEEHRNIVLSGFKFTNQDVMWPHTNYSQLSLDWQIEFDFFKDVIRNENPINSGFL